MLQPRGVSRAFMCVVLDNNHMYIYTFIHTISSGIKLSYLPLFINPPLLFPPAESIPALNLNNNYPIHLVHILCRFAVIWLTYKTFSMFVCLCVNLSGYVSVCAPVCVVICVAAWVCMCLSIYPSSMNACLSLV